MLEYDIVAKVLNRSGTLQKDWHEMWTYQEIQDSTRKGPHIWYRNSQAVRGRKKVSQSHII